MEKKEFVDQMGRHITLSFPPQRIISLVPSQTELLSYLGLEDRVVGITKFCVHPLHKFNSTEKIGGTKNFDFEKIQHLKPDLIIGNKEENYKEGIEELSSKYPVWMSDILTLEDTFEMMRGIGNITNCYQLSEVLIDKIKADFEGRKAKKSGTAAYLIWRKPYMAAGNNTFINEMMKMAGFENVFEDLSRYPVITEEMIADKKPDYILLSSEPYPFKEKHIREFTGLNPDFKVKLVDGEIFSWYGSRLLYSNQYFDNLIEELKG